MRYQYLTRPLLACFCTVLGLAGGAAHAAYPERPVTLVVNYPPGGPLDLVARLIAADAGKDLKQTVVVENKAGAAGTIGAQYVARSKPDGYTLVLSVDTLATVNPFVYKKTDFNANKELEPISMAGSFNQVLVGRSDLGVTTLKDFTELAKKQNLTYASAGVGSPGHLTMEQFAQAQSLKMTHVPYKGNAPATADLLGGQVDAGFLAIAGTIQHIDGKKLIPLAVSGKTRDPLLPTIPTVAESGIAGLENFDVGFGYVMMAPKGTPPEILNQWSQLIAKAFKDPAILERLQTINIQPTHTTPEETKALLAKTAQQWESVVKTANISIN
jgi:tripartite-type tricarboxylate transporter receptor subunit TctC